MNLKPTSQQKSWFIASRWQEFDGEMRAALLRIVMVILFYTVHLANYCFVTSVSEPEKIYHRQVTFAALVWLFLSLAVFVALKGAYFPAMLKYATTTFDIVLLTLLAYLGHGAQSPLVYTMFIVVALAALRFSLGLVWYSALISMAAYLFLVGASDSVWFDVNHETPIITQAVVLLSFGCCGIVSGQIVRSTRRMAEEYQGRLANMNSGVES